MHRLYKSILNKEESLPYFKDKESQIEYGNYILQLTPEEIKNINRLIKIYNSSQNHIFDESVPYSLREMGTVCIISLFKYNITDNHIIVKPSNGKSNDLFFYLTCELNTRIENSIYTYVDKIQNSLRNHYREIHVETSDIETIRNDIIKVLQVVAKISKKQKIKRKSRKYKLSLDRKSVSFYRFRIPKGECSIVKAKNNPFTDTYNNFTEEGIAYYDVKKKSIVNLIIPDKRITHLLDKLRQHKNFVYKLFHYYYEGKNLLFFDIFFAILFSVFYVSIYTFDVDSLFGKGFIEWFKNLAWSPSLFFITKIYMDLKYWIKGFDPLFFIKRK